MLYAAALRNTVHNNGVHLKANKELEISGYKFKLEQNNKVYYERFTEIMILVNEIFNIYPGLFSVGGAVLVLGERLPLQGWLGVATIVGGIVLIAGGSAR